MPPGDTVCRAEGGKKTKHNKLASVRGCQREGERRSAGSTAAGDLIKVAAKSMRYKKNKKKASENRLRLN